MQLPRTATRLIIIECLTLATVSVTLQATPQHVERRTEYVWCENKTGDGAYLERRKVFLIDGKPKEGEDKDKLLVIDERDSSVTSPYGGYP